MDNLIDENNIYSYIENIFLYEFDKNHQDILKLKKYLLIDNICDILNKKNKLKYFIYKKKYLIKNKNNIFNIIKKILNIEKDKKYCNLCIIKKENCKKCKKNIDNNNLDNCCICFEKITSKLNKISICNNLHFIHRNCFSFLYKKNCPLCREYHNCDKCTIYTGNEDEDNEIYEVEIIEEEIIRDRNYFEKILGCFFIILLLCIILFKIILQ